MQENRQDMQKEADKRLLENRHIFITGGASGIGLACAELFLEYGAKVAIMDICSDEKLAEIKEKLGEGCCTVRGDVTDSAQVAACIAKAAEEMGSLDGVVNSAGATENAYIYDLTDESFDRIIKLLLYGTMYTIREASRYMMKYGIEGSMVNLSSMNSIIPYRTIGPYSCGKAGVNMLTKITSLDLAPYHIRVNAVCPGFVETPLTDDVNTPEINKVIMTHLPVKRWCKPVEQAEVIAFLLSEKASYITGTLLMTDGGVSNMAYPDILRVIDGETYYAEM